VDASEYRSLVVMEVAHKCPLGEVETLKNLVPNESFEYDTDSDGLANNWSEMGTAANQTPAIVAVDNRYGAYGQQLTLTANANGTGVKSGTITVTAETEYHLKAWVDPSASTKDFRVAVYDVSNTAEITDSRLAFTAGEAASQETVSFTTPAGCVSVEVRAYWLTGLSGDVVVVDGIYLGLKGSQAPQGWSSYYSIQNHEDGAGNSTDRNWVQVADVPGDVDAVLENDIKHTASSSAVQTMLCGRRTAEEVWLPVLWLQAEDADSYSGSLDTDAAASGPGSNNCVDWTNTVAANEGWRWQITDTDTLRALRGKYRTLLRIKKTGSDETLSVQFYVGTTGQPGSMAASEIVTETLWDTDFMLMLGPVVTLPVDRPFALYDEDYVYIGLYAWGTAGNEFRLDAVLLVPVDEELAHLPDFEDFSLGFAATDRIIMSGMQDQALVYDGNEGFYKTPMPHEGLVVHLTPELPQRLTYVLAEYSALTGSQALATWDLAEPMQITLEYRPRYLSL